MLSAVAGGPGGGGERRHGGKELVCDHARDADVERVGQPFDDRSVQPDATGQATFEPLLQSVAKRCQPLPRTVRQVVGGEPGRRTEGGDEGDALGPRTPTALLSAAVDDRFEVDPGAHVEGRDALRCVHLVPDDGEQVDVEAIHVERDLPGGLRRIAVDQRAVRVGDGRQLADGLERAGLVVRRRHRDDRPSADRGRGRGVLEHLLQQRGLDTAVRPDRQDGRAGAVVSREGRARGEDGGVLGGLGDDVRTRRRRRQDAPT